MDLTDQNPPAASESSILADLLTQVLTSERGFSLPLAKRLRDHLRLIHAAQIAPAAPRLWLYACRLEALETSAPAEVHVVARDDEHAVQRVVEAAVVWAARRMEDNLPVPGVDREAEPVSPQQELQIGAFLSRVQIEARAKVRRIDAGHSISVPT